jgi:hypothetical protein
MLISHAYSTRQLVKYYIASCRIGACCASAPLTYTAVWHYALIGNSMINIGFRLCGVISHLR